MSCFGARNKPVIDVFLIFLGDTSRADSCFPPTRWRKQAAKTGGKRRKKKAIRDPTPERVGDNGNVEAQRRSAPSLGPAAGVVPRALVSPAAAGASEHSECLHITMLRGDDGAPVCRPIKDVLGTKRPPGTEGGPTGYFQESSALSSLPPPSASAVCGTASDSPRSVRLCVTASAQ